MNRQTTGIYHKFNVERVDGSSQPGMKHSGCKYFVLDLTHDKHAPAAMAAYADSCREEYPALADDCKAYVDAAGYISEVPTLRAELAAARQHAEYQDKEIRQWASVCYVGTWPLSYEDTKNTGFYGRLAAKMTAERNTATARAEKAEAEAAALRAHVERMRKALDGPQVNNVLGLIEDCSYAFVWSAALAFMEFRTGILAATPAQSLAACKADTLREIANLIRQTTPGRTSQYDDYGSGKEDGRHYAIEQIESEAERLQAEAANGHQ